jgi:regulator of sigma E protease
MDLLVSIYHLFLIVLGFGALIFVHELGHFLAAKWAGIRTEAFAVGMGPVAIAYRKGIGIRFGSTAKEYEKRVREAIITDQVSRAPLKETSGPPLEELYRVGDRIGLGETEYSLRWLPIGGFVKMLGQEDANPNYVSKDPHSYQNCPISKRMVVVSAGVIMNILLAIVLFVVAFMVGVRFEAPIVGDVADNMPAGRTVADNAAQLGITEPGLIPGDEVLAIDGDPARTFADIQIASAMSKPGVPLKVVVEREGYKEPLRFTLLPETDPTSRLLSLGILPGSSSRLTKGRVGAIDVQEALEQTGLAEQGVKAGMQLVAAEGEAVRTFEQFARILKAKDGEAVLTQWQVLDEQDNPMGPSVEATIEASPEFQVLLHPELSDDGVRDYELGLIGLSPVAKITSLIKGSENVGILEPGDVVLRVNDVVAPLLQQIKQEVRQNAGETVRLLVMRGSERKDVTANVSRNGQVGVGLSYAFDLPNIAAPMTRLGVPANGADDDAGLSKSIPSPIASLNLMPGDRIVAIDGREVTEWTDVREALRAAVANYDKDAGVEVELIVERLFWESAPEHHMLALSPEWCAKIDQLGWESSVPRYIFEPLQTTLSAEGNPIKAVAMGVRETHKLVLLVYLTIDRLVRGSVGVEQLRGPVGIVDLGSKIVPQGAMYFLFFLGMISVNLAVINFLPLPIVDGGLFLYLIYEKVKGQPPPIAFQNVATLIGLALIGTVFLVTFYNDVMRLIT